MTGRYKTNERRQVKVGETYGWMKVLAFAGRNAHGNLQWNCVCQCGAEKVVLGCNLLGGTNPSCGCYKQKVLVDRNTTHGMAHLPEYPVWRNMRARCECETNEDYDSYGGRGIKVCERWADFANFYTDMGPRPSHDLTIERLDNLGDYSPENCVWATRKVQGRNKRNVMLFEYNGEAKSLPEWSEICGIHVETLRKRVNRGWSMERVLNKRPRPIRGVHY